MFNTFLILLRFEPAFVCLLSTGMTTDTQALLVLIWIFLNLILETRISKSSRGLVRNSIAIALASVLNSAVYALVLGYSTGLLYMLTTPGKRDMIKINAATKLILLCFVCVVVARLVCYWLECSGAAIKHKEKSNFQA